MSVRHRPGGPGGPGGPGMMGMPQKARDFRGTVRRLAGYLRPYRFQLLIVVLTAVLSTAFGIVSPKLLGNATTELFNGMIGKRIDFGYIWTIVLQLLGLYVLSSAFSYIQQYVMAGVSQRTVYRLREELNRKLTRLPLRYFDGRTHGEIMSRAVNDMETISTTLQQSMTQLISSVITIIGVLIMMFTISPLMTVILLCTLPVSFILIGIIAKRSQPHFRSQQESIGRLNGHVEEMYGGHRVVKAFGREAKAIEKFDKVSEELYESGWRAQFISGIMMPVMSFVNNIGYVLMCVIGGVLVMRRAIEVGDILAFIQYVRQFSMPIVQSAQIANVLQATAAAAERVFELLDEQEETPDAVPGRGIDRPRGDVSFRDVNFGYSEEAPLMNGLNLDVKAGQTVAIVGPTGAGKTTLVNLLMRFYDVNGGQITIDGVDIRDLPRGRLRSMFGMVLQDTWLYNGTIRDNIAYGRIGATEEDIIRAAEAAHADHFIRTLPDGYHTVLNEEASNISQGQRQLLTIARAILADPAMLILDEATSSVDTRTEALIQKAMLGLMEGRTSFVIAHRLSTIRHADLILVMNQGSVIEQGTHDQLLASGGFYADLYNSQFAGGDQQPA